MNATRKTARATSSDVILNAALEVFLRYGFSKASMDDVAKAAGLTRQGLYLHFGSKNLLFRATLRHIVKQSLVAAEAAVANKALCVEDRLLAAFEALHGQTMLLASQKHISELLATAQAMESSLISGLQKSFIRIIASILTDAGIADRWEQFAVTAKQLAEQLFFTANGIKELVSGLPAYRSKMRIAVTLVVKGIPEEPK